MGIHNLALLTEPEVDLSPEDYAHIIDRGNDSRPANAIVLEARINGTPLTAICGHIFVPSKDPENRPLCPKCEEIYAFVKDFRLGQ